MEKITLSAAFFRNELRAYANWVEAFWRELFQNSIDSGSNNITVEIAKADGGTTITFQDNGLGMTREVLTQVYFVVGETTKADGNSIGGFGRARIITCFAHDWYEVMSCDYVARGSGAHFEVRDSSPSHGCRLRVHITEASTEDLRRGLYDFLNSCQLDCQVLINGERFVNWMHRRRKRGTLSFGSLHISPSGDKNALYVRVSGVTMFKRWIGTRAQAILEIEPSQSRQVLTSNRDGLLACPQEELDRIISYINIEKSCAKRTSHEPVKKVFGTPYRSLATNSEKETQDPPASVPDKEPICFSSSQTFERFREASVIGAAFSDPATSTQQESLTWGPSFIHFVNSSHAAVRRAAKAFERNRIVGTRREALLRGWNTACDIAVEALETSTGLKGTLFGCGFCFSDSNRALHLRDEVGHALLLNPVFSNGGLRYRCSSRKDADLLLAIAAHEVAHIHEEYHDESFAGILTEIFGLIASRGPEIFRAMRSTRSGLQAKAPVSLAA